MKRLLAVALGLLLLWGCGQNSGSTSGSANLVFLSSTLGRAPVARAGAACSVSPVGPAVSGLCYTPTKISGVFSQISISKTSGGAPARSLGGGTEVGFANIFKNAPFNLKTSPTIASSDDNLQDGTGPYNILSVTMQALEIEFTAENPARVYRVRIPFASTPPSSTAAYATCLTAGEKDEADKYGKLFGSSVVQAGDILVCIKNTVTETCADADYQWVNGTALVPIRPGSPKQIAGTYLLKADACVAGASRPSITWGSATMDLNLSAAVDLTAAISAGKKTYTSGKTSGSTLTATIDITSTNSLFVPTTTLAGDLNAATQTQILGAIDNILLKPIYLKKAKTSAATVTDEGMSATVTVKIE